MIADVSIGCLLAAIIAAAALAALVCGIVWFGRIWAMAAEWGREIEADDSQIETRSALSALLIADR